MKFYCLYVKFIKNAKVLVDMLYSKLHSMYTQGSLMFESFKKPIHGQNPFPSGKHCAIDGAQAMADRQFRYTSNFLKSSNRCFSDSLYYA